jgi:hypothetical protein
MESFNESLTYKFKKLTDLVHHLKHEMDLIVYDKNNTDDETRYCKRLSCFVYDDMMNSLNNIETQRKRLWWIPNSHFSIEETRMMETFKTNVYRIINKMYAYIDLLD